MVLAPLPHVAGHVVAAERTRAPRYAADRRRRGRPAARVDGACVVWRLVAPRIATRSRAAGRVFPLRLSGQIAAGPLAIRARVCVADANHRAVWLEELGRQRRGWACGAGGVQE